LLFPKHLLRDFPLSKMALHALLSHTKELGFTEEEILQRSDVIDFLRCLLSDMEWSDTSISETVFDFIRTSPEFASRLYRQARVFPDRRPIISAWMYSMISDWKFAAAWIPLKLYLDGKMTDLAQINDAHCESFLYTCQKITRWSQTNLCVNLISSRGVPDCVQRKWKELIVDPSFRKNMGWNAPHANSLDLCAMIPNDVLDQQRLHDYFYARVHTRGDLEALSGSKPFAVSENPWVQMLMATFLSEASRQLTWAESSGESYGRTVRRIKSLCERPESAAMVADHVPQIVWYDVDTGRSAKYHGGTPMLTVLVHEKLFFPAYLLMSEVGARNCPRYDSLDGSIFQVIESEFPVVAYILCNYDDKNKVSFPQETEIFTKHRRGFDQLFSSKRDLPDDVMVGVWLFLMHARNPISDDVYRYYTEWEPQRVKVLQRASAEVLAGLRYDMTVNIRWRHTTIGMDF
jgi:hypothetical protein